MTLEEFERELAQGRAKESQGVRHREDGDTRSGKDHGRRKRRHDHHHSSRHRRSHDDDYEDSRHRRKRSRHHEDETSRERTERKDRKRRHESRSLSAERAEEDEEDEWVEKEALTAPAGEGTLDEQIREADDRDLKRDAWMEAPSSLDIDYVQRAKRSEDSASKGTKDQHEMKVHKNELNHHLHDIQNEEDGGEALLQDPAQHEVDYEFGDAGSSWRMTRLKAVYRQANETGRPIDDIAIERYGDLRGFDDAREEETELERRKTYGKNYVGKIKPSGDLYQERKLDMSIHRRSEPRSSEADRRRKAQPEQGAAMDELPPSATTTILDQTALNRLKAQLMKAKLRGGPDAERLEAEYNQAAAAAANRSEPEVVVLGAMDSRMLAGSRKGEVKAVETKRGRERGQLEENEDMSIDDMVRQERRTKGQANQGGVLLANRIAKDTTFTNDLDYIDENAAKLAKRVAKSEIDLRNTAAKDFQKMTRILDNCPLCSHEDTGKPPMAPIVSLATRTYLTLPTEPEISDGGACIIPLQHRVNLLECDDDEWEEIRNFMKCLTRMYHDQGREVVFYENAAQPERKKHAAMQAVPLPYSLGETAPAFFKEAILSADEEWSQHRKIIDTLSKAKKGGLGKLAFRRTLVKEMPYFHIWFELDGGLGHVVEDANRWPKGDLFAREVIGGMLDVGLEIIKRQGRWHKDDRRVEAFRKRWRKFDWSRVLTEG